MSNQKNGGKKQTGMITDEQYKEAAKLLNCEVNVIKAVAAVESSGSGFQKDGRLKILFEPHIFWQQLVKVNIDPQKILSVYPSGKYKYILYPKHNIFPYTAGGTQWERLLLAREINRDAANKSASWGKFQIMGFNYKSAGFATVFSMISAFEAGEEQHLFAFVKLNIAWGLAGALRQKNFKLYAMIWNGPGYKNKPEIIFDDYDYKLKKMYDKLNRLI